MLFDIRTLLVAVALANAFCAGARLLLWRMHPGIPGLGRWALAGAAAVIALALVLSYEFTFWKPLLFLAQLSVVSGLLMTWDGFRRFTGRRPLSLEFMIAFTAIVLVWLIASAQFLHSPEFLVVGNAILIAVLSALIARELLTVKTIARAMRVTGWIFVINATVFFIRVSVVNHTHNGQTIDPVDPSGVAAFMLLWWLCVSIAVTLGMILMTSERLQADLDGQANRDPLTGALNRRSFALFTEKAMAQSRRHNKPLSVMIMDLDRFKLINDRLGHEAGDEMLCRFVATADEALRDDDIFCRYGGEEFVALLPNTTAQKALVAAERLRATFEKVATEVIPDNTLRPITVSIGIADLGRDEDFESLLRRADTALYDAKAAGRNRCLLAENIIIQIKTDAQEA